jgi:hypothetical protein
VEAPVPSGRGRLRRSGPPRRGPDRPGGTARPIKASLLITCLHSQIGDDSDLRKQGKAQVEVALGVVRGWPVGTAVNGTLVARLVRTTSAPSASLVSRRRWRGRATADAGTVAASEPSRRSRSVATGGERLTYREFAYQPIRPGGRRWVCWSKTTAGDAWLETPPAADAVYPVGAGADGSFCHRPNSFPWGSLQVANQPMPGTGLGSFASPPSSFTCAPPALMSST